MGILRFWMCRCKHRYFGLYIQISKRLGFQRDSSRYELKTINKRLVRGRNQSASEGKFMGSMAPYGYRAFKLPGEKGNSLCIEPEEAKVVQMIFEMHGKQGIGYNTIAKRNTVLSAEIQKLQSSEAELIQQQCSGAEKKKTSLQIIPTTQHILDNYDILTILEKNQLWKLVLKKVTVYRSQDDELSIQLYPNLPK